MPGTGKNEYQLSLGDATPTFMRMDYINWGGEVSPSSSDGLIREGQVQFEESYHSVPVYTFDNAGRAIGPRKKPH